MNNKFLRIILVLFVLLILAIISLYALLNTQYARNYISVTIENIVNSSIDQHFMIGKLEGNLFSGFRLKDVKLNVEGETFVSIDNVSTKYSLPLLASVILRGDIPLYDTKVSGVEINLIKDKKGIWNFEKLKKDDKKANDKENKEKKTRLINVYLKNTEISDSSLRIINRAKEKEIEFDIQKSSFSIDLIGIHKKFILDSDNINFDVEPFNLKFRNIAAYALITKDNVAFKNLDAIFNNIHIQGQGIINDYGNPAFNISTYIDSFKPGDIGEFNAYIKTSGKSWEYKKFDADMQISLLNSNIKGRRIWTDLKKIKISDTKAFLKGDINTEFGKTNFDGFVDFGGYLNDDSKNSFNVNADISDLDLGELLDVTGTTTGDIQINNGTKLKSSLSASGKWKKLEDFSTSINFRNLSLSEGPAEKLTLEGQANINKNRMELNIDSRIKGLDLSRVIEKIKYKTDLTTSLMLNASIPFKGNIPENLSLNVNSKIDESKINDLTIEHAVIDTNYNKGILNVNELELSSSDLLLSVEGKGTKQNGLDLVYKIKSKDLKIINSLFPDIPLSGTVEADGTIIGKIDNPKLNIVGSFNNLRYKNLFWASTGELDAQTYLNSDLDGFVLNSSIKNSKIAGKKFEVLKLDAKKEGDLIMSEISSVLPENRSFNMNIRIKGLKEKTRILSFENIDFLVNDEKFSSSKPFDVTIDPNKISIDDLRMNFGNGFFEVEGFYGFNDNINLKAELKNIDNSVFTILTGSGNKYTGITNGNISISGNIQNPVISSDIKSQNPGLEGYSLDYANLSIQAKNSLIRVNMESAGSKTGQIYISGTVKSGLSLNNISEEIQNAGLNLEFNSNNTDLSLLKFYVGEITDMQGVLNSNLRIKGTPASPELYGDIILSDVNIRLRSLGNKIMVSNLKITANGRTANIVPSKITSEEGEAELSGNINIGKMTYDLTVDLDKLLLKPRFITANVSGKLKINGLEESKTMITGKLKTSNTKITLLDKQGKEVKEIKFVDESDEPEEFILSEENNKDFYTEKIGLDIDVSIPNDSWVKGKGINVEITGDINLQKKFGQNQYIKGNIDVVRGHYIVFGKLFKIDSGSITFPADGSITPLLDLNASYEVSDVDVLINVVGKADKPKLNLSSNPPMEESDIISYILFGTSRNNIGTQQRNVAGEIASNLAAGEVAGFIGNRFGLDIFSIQGGEQGGLSNPQIKAGSYINEDIYIGYERTPSTYPGNQSTSNNNFILEWKLNDSFSLESQVGGENSGVDIFYNFNF